MANLQGQTWELMEGYLNEKVKIFKRKLSQQFCFNMIDDVQ